MSFPRRFTLPAHGALEFLLGMSMMIAPVVLGFGAGGLLISAALGAVLAGAALTVAAASRYTTSGSHNHFDSMFMNVTAVSALGLAITGDPRAGAFLAAMAVILAALTSMTRYVTV